MTNQGAITKWLNTTPTERQHSRDLDGVYHRADLASAEVAGIAQVTQRALFETMQTNILRQQAERLAPDGAELYALIAVAGAVEMTNVIARMNRPGRR